MSMKIFKRADEFKQKVFLSKNVTVFFSMSSITSPAVDYFDLELVSPKFQAELYENCDSKGPRR